MSWVDSTVDSFLSKIEFIFSINGNKSTNDLPFFRLWSLLRADLYTVLRSAFRGLDREMQSLRCLIPCSDRQSIKTVHLLRVTVPSRITQYRNYFEFTNLSENDFRLVRMNERNPWYTVSSTTSNKVLQNLWMHWINSMDSCSVSTKLSLIVNILNQSNRTLDSSSALELNLVLNNLQ